MTKTITTRIVFDREWNEYVVKVWVDGKRRAQADYHTDDKDDALKTAACMARMIDASSN